MRHHIALPHGFDPRAYQREVNKAIFIDNKKHILQIMHRRAGKTINILNTFAGLAHQRVGLYLYSFPEFKQARRVVWNGFDGNGRKYLDYIPTTLIKRVDNQEMTIEFKNGSILQMVGTDRYDSFVGSNPVAVAYDEYALQNPMARNLLRPILIENGGLEIFCYTPRGKNHGYSLYRDNVDNPEWYVAKLGVKDTKKNDGTPVIPQTSIKSLRDEGYPESLIEQEFYCSFDAGSPGSYYTSYIESLEKRNRIIDFPIQSNLDCYTAWDIGWNDETSICIIHVMDGQFNVIDHHKNRLKPLRYYIDYLKDFAKKHNIRFRQHFAPFDMWVTEFGSGKSRYERGLEQGIRFTRVPKISPADGREEVMNILPRCRFHKTNCVDLVNALRDYHAEYDEKNGVFRRSAVHDWASHPADMFRYFAVAWQEYFLKNQGFKVTTYKT